MEEKPQYGHYEQALAAQDFLAAIELLKNYIQKNPQSVMKRYWLGYALTRVNLLAEAGLQFRQVLLELDQQTPPSAQTAEIYVTKASIYALLQEKEICLQHIYTALWLKPSLFEELPHDITLRRVLLPKDWKQLEATQELRYLLDQLTKNHWEVLPRTNEKTMGQALYRLNTHWELQLAYEAFERGASLLLQSKHDIDEKHFYHFRPLHQNMDWLRVLCQHQDTLTESNWASLSEDLIEVCETLVWEMADKRRIKLA